MTDQVVKQAVKLLGRTAILGAKDETFEDVEVPEWGGTVRVRALSGAERDEFELSLGDKKKGKHTARNVRAKMVSMTCVDEEGRPVFKPQDVRALGEKSAAALDRVFDVARSLSGMTDEDVEEIEENFS